LAMDKLYLRVILYIFLLLYGLLNKDCV